MADGWEQGDVLLSKFKSELEKYKLPNPYYPGVRQRCAEDLAYVTVGGGCKAAGVNKAICSGAQSSSSCNAVWQLCACDVLPRLHV